MKSVTARRISLVCFIVILFLAQDILEQKMEVFKYIDEVFALLVIPVLVIRVIQRKFHIIWDRKKILFLIFFAVFWISGWCGFLIWHYQPLMNTASDAYVNMKFFLAAGAGFLMFAGDEIDYDEMKKKIWPVIVCITVILFVFCVADQIFGLFDSDMRGGLRSIKLFYSSYTILAGNCLFLCAIYFWLYEEKRKKIIIPLLMTMYVMLCTRRVKAAGAAACILLIWLLVRSRRKKISRKVKIFAGIIIAAAVAAGVYQIVNYYVLMGVESARAVLTIAAPFLAADHFPFGTGWGTYGSAFSVEPYSPVYGQYWMAGVWGLSPDYPAFVSDTFWPMIMGQCGFIGFAAFIAAIVLFVKRIFVMKKNRYCFASALVLLTYLFISSTSESAFANPLSVPMAFWLGFLAVQEKALRKKEAAG